MAHLLGERRSKKQLHYRLTNEEWLKAVNELTPRERDILFYLRTLEPFGDSELDLTTRDIAHALGCSAGTVSDCLKSLQTKGWIDITITTAKIRLRSNHSKAESRKQKAESTIQTSELQPPPLPHSPTPPFPKESAESADNVPTPPPSNQNPKSKIQNPKSRSPQRSPIAPAIRTPDFDRPSDHAIAPAITDRPSDHDQPPSRPPLTSFPQLVNFYQNKLIKFVLKTLVTHLWKLSL